MTVKHFPTKYTYLGLFTTTLATVMYELLLTRIFSVTMWYHFAFVAISVAMFGMTLGAILVYLFPYYFTQKRVTFQLALSALFFAVSIVFSFLIHLRIPFMAEASLTGLFSVVLTYAVLSVPFVFSGICVCLALTRFPQQVSKLYAADLLGAAIGCVLLIYVLDVTDGPTAVLVVACFASLGSVFFITQEESLQLKRAAVVISFMLASLAVFHTVLAQNQSSLLRLRWVKGVTEPRPLYEKWNSFSRIAVFGNPTIERAQPFGWGLSAVYRPKQTVRQLMLQIDACAGTPLTAFNGTLNAIEHLRYDVTNVAHYLRHPAKVLVIGPGGGRDLLSALVFGQRRVVGVEINRDIINTVNQRFGDFTGHLDRYPQITFVNDEARSYIARQHDQFDIIQVSLIDTFAATAAGAFVLSENSLYTVEAWKIFLEHLTPNGILTVSRWYLPNRPGEMYRLASLASASLIELGVENPRTHTVTIRSLNPSGPWGSVGVGTTLVSKAPFSLQDLTTLEEIARQMQFDIVVSPRFALDATWATLASGTNLETFTAEFPLNITAPTDDSPFFFNMLRFKDIFNQDLWQQDVSNQINLKAVFILGELLATVIGLTSLCIIVPLILTTKKEILRGSTCLFIFFACIGLGYMLVEISQMQRLIVFLGHPIYGLSVVLFTLLLASGLGSFVTQVISGSSLRSSGIMRLFLLLCTLGIFGVLTPSTLKIFQGSITSLRILIAMGILFPLGLFMGMAFPLGMRIASLKSATLTPWLWGINGSTSVCASVLAVVIALSKGITASFWVGFVCYAIAFLAFVLHKPHEGGTRTSGATVSS